MIRKPLPFLLSVILAFAASRATAQPLRDGDIIFHTSRSAQSLAIQKATHSKYSHMGIVFLRGGEPYVYEAIGTVQYTPLKKWIARGEGGHYVVKRLRDADRILTPDGVARLRHAAARFAGRPYDLTFEWSDQRIYCSELVWKVYDRALGVRVGRLQKLREFDLSDPRVKAKMKERYGHGIPLTENVISPGEMFAFDGLVVVDEK
ncbi:MAG TPA: YiiX family permuted papain-like enzyme [Gallionellaceae bacterium]